MSISLRRIKSINRQAPDSPNHSNHIPNINNADPLHHNHTKKEAVAVQGITEEAPTISSVIEHQLIDATDRKATMIATIKTRNDVHSHMLAMQKDGTPLPIDPHRLTKAAVIHQDSSKDVEQQLIPVSKNPTTSKASFYSKFSN